MKTSLVSFLCTLYILKLHIVNLEIVNAMAFHNILGKQGEDEASYYLLKHDYRILERNWQGQDCEVDIIADYYGEVVFVEVKTRSNTDYALPEDAVDANRMYRLSRAAEEYLCRNGLTKHPYRFDILALDGIMPPFQIRHIQSAFGLKPKKHYPKF